MVFFGLGEEFVGGAGKVRQVIFLMSNGSGAGVGVKVGKSASAIVPMVGMIRVGMLGIVGVSCGVGGWMRFILTLKAGRASALESMVLVLRGRRCCCKKDGGRRGKDLDIWWTRRSAKRRRRTRGNQFAQFHGMRPRFGGQNY